MIDVIANTPDEAIAKATRVCDNGVAMNLTISFPMEVPASNVGLLASFREEAKQWQRATRPTPLHLNHGEYMYSHGDWLEFVTTELRNKPTSNRACVSLVDSAPIFASGDGPLPSFMLLQVGFNGPSRDTLYVTSYYRALEVSAFLPINVTEMALIADQIADRFPSIARAEVTMHAFRAHSNPGFRALQRNKLDMAGRTRVHNLVVDGRHEEIAELLEEKSAPASIIEDAGLTILRDEAQASGWSNDLLDELDRAISALTRLRQARSAGTHEIQIENLQRQLSEHLLRCAEMVRNER
ncbi:hypothetical protein ACF1AJ_13515 [Leifsonia sp. NPDC014704]|uniref:hypothetical protein n=1 Tax=Leifsonia sp. NPDC014704 TaxID=3364123 RepID=UPI0036F4511F